MEKTERPTSTNTKILLANSFRELLRAKDFSKITVTDVAERSGVNRKTFYYHFHSTEALLAWMFEREAADVVSRFDDPDDLSGAINFVVDYIKKNQTVLRSINNSIGHGAMHKFLFNSLAPLAKAHIAAYGEEYADEALQHDDNYLQFVAEFYTEAIVGTLQSWIEKPVLRDSQELVEYTSRLLSARDPAK